MNKTCLKEYKKENGKLSYNDGFGNGWTLPLAGAKTWSDSNGVYFQNGGTYFIPFDDWCYFVCDGEMVSDPCSLMFENICGWVEDANCKACEDETPAEPPMPTPCTKEIRTFPHDKGGLYFCFDSTDDFDLIKEINDLLSDWVSQVEVKFNTSNLGISSLTIEQVPGGTMIKGKKIASDNQILLTIDNDEKPIVVGGHYSFGNETLYANAECEDCAPLSCKLDENSIIIKPKPKTAIQVDVCFACFQ